MQRGESRILKNLADIKIVKNRSVLYEIERGKPQNRTYEAFKLLVKYADSLEAFRVWGNAYPRRWSKEQHGNS